MKILRTGDIYITKGGLSTYPVGLHQDLACISLRDLFDERKQAEIEALIVEAMTKREPADSYVDSMRITLRETAERLSNKHQVLWGYDLEGTKKYIISRELNHALGIIDLPPNQSAFTKELADSLFEDPTNHDAWETIRRIVEDALSPNVPEDVVKQAQRLAQSYADRYHDGDIETTISAIDENEHRFLSTLRTRPFFIQQALTKMHAAVLICEAKNVDEYAPDAGTRYPEADRSHSMAGVTTPWYPFSAISMASDDIAWHEPWHLIHNHFFPPELDFSNPLSVQLISQHEEMLALNSHITSDHGDLILTTMPMKDEIRKLIYGDNQDLDVSSTVQDEIRERLLDIFERISGYTSQSERSAERFVYFSELLLVEHKDTPREELISALPNSAPFLFRMFDDIRQRSADTIPRENYDPHGFWEIKSLGSSRDVRLA